MRHAAIVIGTIAALGAGGAAAADLAELVTRLDRGTQWTETAAIPVGFVTHHPQGMVRVGDHLFVSSVEIIEPTERYATPEDGYDRSAGSGKGHLFKLDLEGNLVGQVELGEGDIYHPGGIDYDGAALWVPVAEYRPNSASIVYKVDPETLAATEVFRFGDHLGGVVHDPANGSLHAVSWGSRRFYTFGLAEDGGVPDATKPREELLVENPAHYIDYQDCHLAGPGRAICTGLTNFDVNGARLALGGIELVDLAENRPLHQVPVQLWTEDGLAMTNNPVWLEADGDRVRAYFMPEDDESRLFIYEATPAD